jgi:hypothetical protein
MFTLYNSLLREDLRMERWQARVEPWNRELATCSIEAMLVNLLLHGDFKFPRQDCNRSYDQFAQGRFSKTAFELPPLLELMLQVELANAALAEGKFDDFDKFITAAIGDTGGRPTVQAILLAARKAVTRVEPSSIFAFVRARVPSDATPEASEVAAAVASTSTKSAVSEDQG